MLRSPLAPDILENRIRFYGHMNKKDYGDDVVIGLLKLTINEVKKKCMMIFRTTAAFFYYHLHGMSFFYVKWTDEYWSYVLTKRALTLPHS